jgi:hypothetical protein
MNFVVIILGIIVVFLLYYLYTTYLNKGSNLTTKVDLKTSNPAIPFSTLPNNTSTRYAYGVWVYVNTWNSNFVKTILSRGSDFKLTIDQTNPTLRCNVAAVQGTNPDIVVTQNFPIQKWTYVIISVDNQIVDCYLDGKLVLSSKLPNIPIVSSADIAMGDSNNPDIFLALLNRWATPMDPQTAWNNYLQGNGMSSSSNMNIKLAVLQDNIEQKAFSLY